MNELTLNISKNINAPINKVFEAWLNPETLAKFIMPMPGMQKPEITMDATVNGKYEVIMIMGELRMPHSGEYLEISKYNRLVFTWESEFSPKGSTVSLNFTKISENETKIDLEHVKFLNEDTKNNHIGGWTNILDSLANTI